MYEIEVNYTTGNSFGSHQETDRVGYTWDKLEDAQVALANIKAHYLAYEAANGWGSKKVNVSREPWYYKGDYEDYWQYGLMVPGNDGELVKISAFWCGYFETLHGATIVDDINSFEL